MPTVSKESVLLSRIRTTLSVYKAQAIDGSSDNDDLEILLEDLDRADIDGPEGCTMSFGDANRLLEALEQHKSVVDDAGFDLIASTALSHLATAVGCAHPVERSFRYTAQVQPYIVSYEGDVAKFKKELRVAIAIADEGVGLASAPPLKLTDVRVTQWRIAPTDITGSSSTGFLKTATLSAAVEFNLVAVADDWEVFDIAEVLKLVHLKIVHQSMGTRRIALKEFVQVGQAVR